MNKIKVLDCTLRDGGYINQWQFGEKNIKEIISSLIDSKVDIVECGFLTEKKERNQDSSLFDSIERIAQYLPVHRKDSMTVCMINYGEYDVENLPQYDGTSIDGIRVAFHKNDLDEALKMCETIMRKGYKLFMQPMVTVSYSDEEFISLINRSNKLNPYAFYIVDSFGVMKRKDLMRLYYLVDHNLSNDIFVGYHSHNNIQMAYSNAQALVDLKTKRKIIIDSSVFGMGRGAGNLNTELFIEYLNELNGSKYKIKPLLKIIDQVLSSIYASNFWGYSLPHYVSAMNNCHPNYASYLDDKSTLTVENINEILEGLEESKRNNFDKEYVEKLYIQYQNRAIADDKAKIQLTSYLKNKSVIIIAPGSSINEEKEKIYDAKLSENNLTIAINFKPEKFECDYVFVSNLRRYEDLKNYNDLQLIKTSNIKNGNVEGIVVNYSDLLNDVEAVEDNAGMMLIKLLIDIGVEKIKLAGLDGYSHDIYDNFANKELAFIKNAIVMDAMNSGMEKMLNRFAEVIDIEFITTPRFVKLGENQ
jgi:4-hydroxy 2-oxovalerate aldolase